MLIQSIVGVTIASTVLFGWAIYGILRANDVDDGEDICFWMFITSMIVIIVSQVVAWGGSP